MSQGKLRCISSVCKPPFWVSYFNDGFKVLIDVITQKNYLITHADAHTCTSHQISVFVVMHFVCFCVLTTLIVYQPDNSAYYGLIAQ